MTGRAVGGAPGRAERFPAQGPTRARGPGGGATVHVNGGARRAHHPSGINKRVLRGGLAWIKPSKKDMAVTFSYSPLEY